MRRFIVAITGASGAAYAQRVLNGLAAADCEIFLVVSPLGRRLLHDELAMEKIDLDVLAGRKNHRLTLLPYQDTGACIASGSFLTDGMAVVPCSGNKLAEMATGLGDNLISRAAQVALKERRRLVVVHREMPLTSIDLRNMQALAEAGAIICPANPGFYLLPRTVDDIVNFVAAKVLDLLGVPHNLQGRWGDANISNVTSESGT
jgi:4-hydroxy-3-polyprenylbenzoate decarboxylase